MKSVLKIATIVLILGTLVACASPPKVENDPNVRDDGIIIMNMGGSFSNGIYNDCRPPYRIGSYCDTYYYYLRNNQNNP